MEIVRSVSGEISATSEIPDGDVGESRIDTHILGLSDRDRDRNGMFGSTDLQEPLRICHAQRTRRQQDRRGREHKQRKRGEMPELFLPVSAGAPPRIAAPARKPARNGHGRVICLVCHCDLPRPDAASPN